VASHIAFTSRSYNNQSARLRTRLLSGTALAVCALGLAGAARANDITVTSGTITTPVPGSTLWAIPVGGTTVATVDTADLSAGALNAIWILQAGLGGTDTVNISAGRTVSGVNGVLVTAATDTISITNNGTIRATFDGIYAQNTLSGNITVAGAGTIDASAGRNGMWLLTPTGDVTVGAAGGPVGPVSGALNGIVVTGGTGPININATSVTATTGNGIWTVGTTGNQSISATGLVTAGLNGVLAGTTTGNIATSTNGVNSAGFGVVTTTVGGNTTVTDTATINSVNTGIWTTGATGNTAVTANNVISTGNFGIFSTSTSGNNTISTTGTISGATNGILSVTSSGNNVVTGNGTSVVTGGIEGIYVNPTTTGNATITNFASVTGDRAGIWTVAGSGVTSIQGNGPITGNGNWGVLSQSITGDINVGNTAANGVITGALIGLQATSGTGNINVTTNRNVTGTGNIGLFTSTAGDTVNNITAGNVTGGVWGMDTLAQGSGNITNNIAAGSTVRGGAIGLVTGTIAGTSTTNNAGIITTTGDTGAAGTAGGLANSNVAGTNIVNNTGQLIGGVATAGIAYTLNNQAAGVWTPSLANAFGSASDTVNNTGRINVRSGDTVFAGLETFRNQAGGAINMQYGPAATDTLTVLNFTPQAGGVINVNVEPGAANGAGDSGGQGRGDTIVVVGTANPTAATTINIASLGAAPSTLTGSIAIVNTSAADVLAPSAGAVLTASTNYALGAQNLPLAGAKFKYTLVDDGAGGVFLVWQPNLSAAALGGFGGALGAGAQTAPGSAIGSAAAGSSGLGGVGLGGGPTGGGVLGRIGDMAAADASSSGGGQQGGSPSGGSLKDAAPSGQLASHCRGGRGAQVWAQIEGERTNFSGGHSGRSENLSSGVELDVGRRTNLGCNRVAVGVFGFTGTGRANWVNGAIDSDNSGFGGYLRATSAMGFYATLLGATNWSDAKLTNAVFGSTANKDGRSLTLAGSAGFVAKVAPGMSLDLRGFASNNQGKGSPFTDTAGISVSGTRDDILTYGVSLGLHAQLTPTLQGFVRAGLKRSQLDSSVTAFDTTVKGSVSSKGSGLEAGLVGNITNDIQVGASGFGSFSDGATGYGGRAHVGIKF
jgi:hypothetical protein